jgi:hypothetical protein
VSPSLIYMDLYGGSSSTRKPQEHRRTGHNPNKQARTHPQQKQDTSAGGRSEPGWNTCLNRQARSPNAIRITTQLPLHNPPTLSTSAFVRSAIRELSVGLCSGNCVMYWMALGLQVIQIGQGF